ncbi:hypothetical protein BDE02_07G073300 [Populus trichocarpa]|nr:hypothetical protein BDE02_07G073300 [Populus trichocarpa]
MVETSSSVHVLCLPLPSSSSTNQGIQTLLLLLLTQKMNTLLQSKNGRKFGNCQDLSHMEYMKMEFLKG